jgi:hypothetical protein
MALLDFLEEIEREHRVSRIDNFWKIKKHDVPSTPGVYILIAKRGMMFRYPRGKSPVYYIGQTNSLKRRLCGHWRWHDEVRQGKRSVFQLYEARHEYGGKFGGRYCYIKTWPGMSPKGLEEIVLARFAKQFRTFPVANSAAAWNRIEREFKNGKR